MVPDRLVTVSLPPRLTALVVLFAALTASAPPAKALLAVVRNVPAFTIRSDGSRQAGHRFVAAEADRAGRVVRGVDGECAPGQGVVGRGPQRAGVHDQI